MLYYSPFLTILLQIFKLKHKTRTRFVLETFPILITKKGIRDENNLCLIIILFHFQAAYVEESFVFVILPNT